MATVIQKPPDFGGKPLGAAIGEGLGKGLSSFLQERMDRDKKQALLKGLSDLEDALSSSASIEDAQKVDPFKFIDQKTISDAGDVSAIASFRDSRIKALFPDKVPLVDPETGKLEAEIGKGRSRETVKGLGVTPAEFKALQTGKAAKTKARAAGKFTLSDEKLRILLTRQANERAGRPAEAGLTETEISTIAPIIKDLDVSFALKIATESRQFFRLAKQGAAAQAKYVQTLLDVVKLLRKGKKPNLQQQKELGDPTLKDVETQIDLDAAPQSKQVSRGRIGEPAAQATILQPPAAADIPADLLAAGITEADVVANLNFLRAKEPQITREQVIRALQAKIAKGGLGGQR